MTQHWRPGANRPQLVMRRPDCIERRRRIDRTASLAEAKNLFTRDKLVAQEVYDFDLPRFIMLSAHLKALGILPEFTTARQGFQRTNEAL